MTGVEKVISIRANGIEQLFYAELECFVDLAADRKGAHMSRFEEVVNEAIDEVVLSESLKAETLASHIAERVRDRQGGLRAEVTIAARYPENKPTPVSGSMTQEIYTLFGAAVASQHGTRRVVGVQAQGMTACPCAQEMVSAGAREALAEERLRRRRDRAHPRARPGGHPQPARHRHAARGLPHRLRGDGRGRRPAGIVEDSMSSEIYELMKRPDEQEVVEKAHRRPRFVEDCVREMVRMGTERFAHLGDGAFLSARQENLETIHKHNVVAERHGLMSELAQEVAGGERAGHPHQPPRLARSRVVQTSNPGLAALADRRAPGPDREQR